MHGAGPVAYAALLMDVYTPVLICMHSIFMHVMCMHMIYMP